MKIFTIISVLFGGFCLFWLWLHWGRRGAYVAMFASYYTAKRALKRNNPSATEKEILIHVLRSRYTYKDRPLKELEDIVSNNSTIESLTKFVIEDEGKGDPSK